MKNRDWRPTAFVDTAPPAGPEQEPPAKAGLLAFLRVLIAVDALAGIAITLHGAPRAPTSVALVGLLLGLVLAGHLHLRLLTRPATSRDPRTAGVAFALLLAAAFTAAGGWWSSGLR